MDLMFYLFSSKCVFNIFEQYRTYAVNNSHILPYKISMVLAFLFSELQVLFDSLEKLTCDWTLTDIIFKHAHTKICMQ